MERIVANLAGTTRRDKRNGRDYLVAPATLIVPGVLNGSQGPLLYPLDEIQRTADAWNGMPIVVGHPEENGSPVSARTPSVLDRVGIGEVFNVKSDGKLAAEAWFDVLKTDAVDSRILNALRAGKPVELSTGLFTENEDAPAGSATANGTGYIATARNYKPDHLAILPDSIGACSVADGCGVLVNAAALVGFTGMTAGHQHVATVNSDGGNGITSESDGHRHPVRDFKVKKEVRGGHTHPLDKTGLVDSGVRNDSLRNKESEMDPKEKTATIDGLIANVCCWKEEDREVLNGLSDEHLTELVENGEKTARQELVANAATAGYEDALGTHKIGETGEWVHNLKEPTDNGKHGDKKGGKGKRTEDTPPTRDEWLALAPPDVVENLAFAEAEKQRQKDVLIATLTANVADADRPGQVERLQSRSLADLQQDVDLLPTDNETAKLPVPNWAGAAGGPPIVNRPALDQDDVLEVPVINYSEKETVPA